MSGGLAVGIDIGGTFTELVLRGGAGHMRVHRVTTDDLARGALDGMRELLDRTGTDARPVELLVHSTTLVTNGIIDDKKRSPAAARQLGFRAVRCAPEGPRPSRHPTASRSAVLRRWLDGRMS